MSEIRQRGEGKDGLEKKRKGGDGGLSDRIRRKMEWELEGE